MGSIPRGLVFLATGSIYWAVQNRGWFGTWAQGPGNWSKPLVVHVVINGASAAGPAMAPAAELVLYRRPSCLPAAPPWASSALGPVTS